MKFVELKKHILTNNFYCCYNIYGDDDFLIASAENLFSTYAIQNAEFNKTTISTENLDAEKLLLALNTNSFFADKKLVVLKVFDEQKIVDYVGAIVKYSKLPNSNTILLVLSKNAVFDKKNQENFSKIQNFFCEVDCCKLDRPMLFAWINMSLKEKNASMTDDAKALLVDYSNSYLSKISMELNKLISYVGVREIEKSDVELLVSKELEYNVFELTENLGLGNKEKTLQIFEDMMNDKKAAPSVFSLIQNYYRRLFYASITAKTNAQIAQDLGVKEYAIKKAKETASLYSKIMLKQIVSLCDELDFKIKTSQIDYRNATYYLLLFILDGNKKS